MDVNDFSIAIDNLRRRASSARKTRSIIASVLFILSLVIFGIIYINTTSGLAKGMSDVFKKLSLNDNIDSGIEAMYSNAINTSNLLAGIASSNSNKIAKTNEPDNGKSLEASKDEFERMVKNLEVKSRIMDSYADLKGVRYRLGQGNIINSVTTSFATIAFSICSILLLVFLVQISVMFMRYYAQLAELYDSQALALIVSEGNTDKAISFAKEFSPRVISIGKSPDSVYEKAFEVIGNVINKKEK